MSWRAFSRRSIPYLVALAGGFLLAYFIVAAFVFPARLISTDTKVPSVVGMPWEQAQKKLQDAGFTVKRGEQRFHLTAPAGTVLEQNPVADALEPKSTAVVLDLSRGQRQAHVPQIVGLTRQQAELALQNAGLDPGDVNEQESSAARGQVLASIPPAGTQVPEPSSVNFTVSAGPGLVTVPDVTGQSYPAARQLLVQLGFTVVPATPDSLTTAPPGTVTSQNPAANQTVPGGTAVRLTIAAPVADTTRRP